MIKLWWARNFGKLDISDALKYNLTFVRNIFGDEINYVNCRSIWKDKNGMLYQVYQLYINNN